MVTVEDPEVEGAFVGPLESIGYELRVREPGHLCSAHPLGTSTCTSGLRAARTSAGTCCSGTGSGASRGPGFVRGHQAGSGRPVADYYARAKGPFIAGVVERAWRAAQEG